MSNLKIVSTGITHGTKVYVGDEQVTDVSRVEIEPMDASNPDFIKAIIYVNCPLVEMDDSCKEDCDE